MTSRAQAEEAKYDVVVIGGGPGGLNAALVLGRARKKVLVCDEGPPRNALAEHLHGFVTRDGIAPPQFRAIAREQLAPYDVTFRAERVEEIVRDGAGFRLGLRGGGSVVAQRVVLATGMIDQPLELPGMKEAWGHTVFQCPHCHGWERRDRQWGTLITDPHMAEFPLMLRGWTSKLVAFTLGAFEIAPELAERFRRAEIVLETRPIRRLRVEAGGVLRGAELEDGAVQPLEFLFHAPKQHLPALVKQLGLELTEQGFVRVDFRGETSMKGVYAAGDLLTPGQAAIAAAATGALTGWMITAELNFAGHATTPGK